MIDAAFATPNSFLSALTYQDGSEPLDEEVQAYVGTINLNFDNSARWYVPADNTLSNGLVTLSNQGGIVLGHEMTALDSERARTSGYTRLDVQNLKSTDGVLELQLDINAETSEPSEDAALDQMSFAGVEGGEGTLQALIALTGDDVNDQNFTNHWFLEQRGSGTLTVTGHEDRFVYLDGSPTSWQIAYFEGDDAPGADDDFSTLGSVSSGAGHWYLVRSDQTGGDGGDPDPDDPSTPPEVTDNVTIGTSASQALAYMADLEDLRKRLGEVRYGAQAGAWAKAFVKKDSVNASGNRGFEQDVYGINIGLDSLVGASESSSWLIGGAFRYSNADQDGIGIGGTTGELDEYSVKGYATWMHEKGSYADIVLQAGRYEQELDGLSNTREARSHADYGTWGFGASIEVGHMFAFAEDENDRRWFNHCFIEPQLELSYFHARGADYRTSTGLKVSQDNADFLTGRAGLVLGKKFSYGTVDELDRRYFQFAVIGGVKHEFLGGDQTIRYAGVNGARASVHADDIDGKRFYYGLNADWQIADDFRLYAQIDREEGDHYTKDYDVSVGMKWSF